MELSWIKNDYRLLLSKILLSALLLSSCAHKITKRCCPANLTELQILTSMQFSGEGKALFRAGDSTTSFSFESLLNREQGLFLLELSKAFVGDKLLTISLTSGQMSGDAVRYLRQRISSRQWRELKSWAQQLATLLYVLRVRQCSTFRQCQEMLGQGWYFSQTANGQMLITFKEQFQLALSGWKEGRFYLYSISQLGASEGPSLTLKFD